MSAPRPVPRDPPYRSAGGYLLTTAALAALGSLGKDGAGIGLLLAGIGGAASVALAVAGRGPRAYSPLPLLGASAALALLATPSTLSELFAGAAGLLLLLAIAQSAGEPRPLGRALPTVGLPSLALALALGSTIALPSGSAQVGAAAALLVAVFLLLAYLFARQEAEGGGGAPPS